VTARSLIPPCAVAGTGYSQCGAFDTMTKPRLCFCGATLPEPKPHGSPPVVCPGLSVYVDGRRVRQRSACEEIRGALGMVASVVDDAELTPGQRSHVARTLNALRMRVTRRGEK